MKLHLTTPHQEHIFQKQLRFLALPYEGLSNYYSPKSQAIRLVECQKIPHFISDKVQIHHTVKHLSRLPSNNIMIVMMAILHLAYTENVSNELLRTIKKYAYNEQFLIVRLLEESQRASQNQQAVKKLFVEFFHLVGSNSSKNKVEKHLYKYPIMQCIFILLCRKILVTEGIVDAANLQLPVPTIWVVQHLCKAFQINFQTTQPGVYKIGEHLIAEDSSFVYKTCEKQFPTDDDQNDEEKVIRLLQDSRISLDQNSQTKFFPTQSQKSCFSRPFSTGELKLSMIQLRGAEYSHIFPYKTKISHGNLNQVQNNMPLNFNKTKNKSQALTQEISIASYHTYQSSCIPHPFEKAKQDHQRSNSNHNILSGQNLFQPPTPLSAQRQKSYQNLPSYRVSSFSPQQKFKNPQFKNQLGFKYDPLSYFKQPLLAKNNDSLQKRYHIDRISSLKNMGYKTGQQYGY